MPGGPPPVHGGAWYPGPYDGGPPPASQWHPPPPPPRRRGARAVAVVAVVAFALALLGPRVDAVRSWWGDVWPAVDAPDYSALVVRAGPDTLPAPVAPQSERPTPGFEEQAVRLRPAVTAWPTDEPYELLATWTASDGTERPVAWSPCRPIHVVLNPDGAPADAEDQLVASLGAVSAATGLEFVYDGTTDEPASGAREPFQPQRYGDRWAPVLVAFVDALTHDGEPVAGLTGSRTARLGDGPGVRLTAQVRLDRDSLAYPSWSGVPGWVAVLRHELGHVVGLAHVEDPGELMYPEAGLRSTFADGDLAGLAVLGAGECSSDF